MKSHQRIAQSVQELGPLRRRRFLEALGLALGAASVPEAVRLGLREMTGGVAFAQAASEATYFLEFNFRDQVDLMHVAVPPSLARAGDGLVRGTLGDACTLFARSSEIVERGGLFFTADSLELAEHAEHIAVLDTGPAGIGVVHGHEAAGAMRSPGRTKTPQAGLQPMHTRDPSTGDEPMYGSVPTPASLHNFIQKRLTPELYNGFAFKGISRNRHTAFHFAAGLAGGELDRIKTRADLLQRFEAYPESLQALTSREEASIVRRLLERMDRRFLTRRGYAEDQGVAHLAQLAEAEALWYQDDPFQVSLVLPDAEWWSDGVPAQRCSPDDREVVVCGTSESMMAGRGFTKAQVWEQFAYAARIFESGATRTIALEFDFMDLHGDGARTEDVVRVQAQQCARPLARFIRKMKDAGLWDRTLVAVFTTDGSRRPAANSYGDDGKGTVLLAGGQIRGGYYGDIEALGRTATGHSYGFRPPNPETGAPLDLVTDWSDPDHRTDAAAIWRTVMSAAGVGPVDHDAYDQVRGAGPIRAMLRS